MDTKQISFQVGRMFLLSMTAMHVKSETSFSCGFLSSRSLLDSTSGSYQRRVCCLHKTLERQIYYTSHSYAGLRARGPSQEFQSRPLGLSAWVMTDFTDTSPNLETYWRSIVLFGRNVASYKFALAKSLLEIGGAEKELIRLEDLAEPFSRNVCEHLKLSPKQSTSPSSKFLNACRAYNSGDLSKSDLIGQTTQLGFANVIDAFHIVNQGEIPKRFFLDERRQSAGIRLTDDFFRMSDENQVLGFGQEVEARWRLVETAWELGLSRNLAGIEHDSELSQFFTGRAGRRVTVTSSRSALNGYQKGCCFYCFDRISILEGDARLADVDHFFPHVLKPEMPDARLDGIWNLVLACKDCNRGHDGKFARLPDTGLVKRLNTRNEFLIGSHHPLRETLMNQTGSTEGERKSFLQKQYNRGREFLIHTWQPILRANPVF